MSSISAFNAGLQGLHQGMNGLRKNAHAIANATTPAAAVAPEASTVAQDVTEPLVAMKLNQLQAQASTKVIQTSADMIGTLIDMKA